MAVAVVRSISKGKGSYVHLFPTDRPSLVRYFGVNGKQMPVRMLRIQQYVYSTAVPCVQQHLNDKHSSPTTLNVRSRPFLASTTHMLHTAAPSYHGSRCSPATTAASCVWTHFLLDREDGPRRVPVNMMNQPRQAPTGMSHNLAPSRLKHLAFSVVRVGFQ